MGKITPWRGTQFSGFMDDELGKLANIAPRLMSELRASSDPFAVLQQTLNPTSVDELSNYLLNCALFSDPLLAVDGWFLLTPNWWDAIFDRQNYPLISMLEEGLISSFSRYDGVLHDLPEKEAAKGIVTYQNILDDARFPKLRKILESFDNRSIHSYVPWPSYDMDQALDSLLQGSPEHDIRGVFDHTLIELGINDCLSQTQWDHLKGLYEANRKGEGLAKRDSSRQAWIRAIMTSLQQFELSTYAVRELATIGIKAYHQSRALVLDVHYASREIKGSSVPTEFLQEAEFEGATMEEDDFFDGILSLSVSAKEVAQAGKMDVVKELGTTGSNLYDLKTDFLLARDKWLLNPVGTNYSQYWETAIRYMESLNPRLGVPVRVSGESKFLDRLDKLPKAKMLREAVGGVITVGTSAAGSALLGPGGALAAKGLEAGAKVAYGAVGQLVENMPFLQGKLKVAVKSADFAERARRRNVILNVYRQGPHTISPVRADQQFSERFRATLKEY